MCWLVSTDGMTHGEREEDGCRDGPHLKTLILTLMPLILERGEVVDAM